MKSRASKNTVERKRREIQATKRSVKNVSEVSMEVNDEDKLVNLIARLDRVKLISEQEAELLRAPPQRSNKMWDSHSEDSGDEKSDRESDSEGSEEEANNTEEKHLIASQEEPTSITESTEPIIDIEKKQLQLTKREYMKKLIRDDRKERKAFLNGEKISAEKLANKIRSKMLKMSTSMTSSSSSSIPTPTTKPLPLCTPTYDPSNTPKKSNPIGTSIRMNIIYNPKAKSKKPQSKLMVFSRNLTVNDMVTQVRNKCQAHTKYNALLVISTNKRLLDVDLMWLPDDESVELVIDEEKGGDHDKKAHHQHHIATATTIATNGDDDEKQVKQDPITTMEHDSNNIPNDNKGDDKEDNDNDSEEEEWKPPQVDYTTIPLFPTIEPNTALNTTLAMQYETAKSHPSYTTIQSTRHSLPIYALKSHILHTIATHQVVVISGATGSGKTTQTPAYLLEEMLSSQVKGSECHIVMTQPRRLATISVTERIHEEFCTKIPLASSLIGYQIRLDCKCNHQTRLLVCTTGILLKKLLNPFYLNTISHIILDEVHERSVEIDFLMALLKQQLPHYPHLRVILMSASMQETVFTSYFTSEGGTPCPLITIPGRTYPVKVQYLPEVMRMIGSSSRNALVETPPRGKSINNANTSASTATPSSSSPAKLNPLLVADLVCHIIKTCHNHTSTTTNTQPEEDEGDEERFDLSHRQNRGNAILIFLSGLPAIQAVHKALKKKAYLYQPTIQILMLHSSLPPEQQKRIFTKTSVGEWKIILSTNIAETSITVDDVTHVIDSGYMKEMRYNPITRLACLQEIFCARSNATQRTGRAGRVCPGICYRLYTQEYFENRNTDPTTGQREVLEYGLPEIQRISLEEIVLQVLLLQLSTISTATTSSTSSLGTKQQGRPELFLLQCIEAPTRFQIYDAIANLIELKAIVVHPKDGNFVLTCLGYHLAKMPVDIHIGKMLIYASLLQCLDPILTIAAALSNKSPFLSPSPFFTKSEDDKRAFRQSQQHFLYSSAGASRLHSGSEDCQSDHIAIVHAYNAWHQVLQHQGKATAVKFCKEHGLAHGILLDMKQLREHFREYLRSVGFVQSKQQHRINNNATKATATAVKEEEEQEDLMTGLDTLPISLDDIVEDESTEVTDMLNDDIDDDNGNDNGNDNDLQQQQKLSKSKPTSGKKANKKEVAAQEQHTNDKLLAPIELIRCALCAGLYPRVIRAISVHVDRGRNSTQKSSTVKFLQMDQQSVSLHPSSLLYGRWSSIIPDDCQDAFLVYHLKTGNAGTQINIFEASVISHEILLLFAGNEITIINPKTHTQVRSVQKQKKRRTVRIQMNQWIEMEISEMHMMLYRKISKAINQLLRMYITQQELLLSSSSSSSSLNKKGGASKKKGSTSRQEAWEEMQKKVNEYQSIIQEMILILLGDNKIDEEEESFGDEENV